MAYYKCGYCGTITQDDIWCSEEHRQQWYIDRRVMNPVAVGRRRGRYGPQKGPIGPARRARVRRVEKT